MFIGHFALGFAAKKIAPKTNLAWNFFACQFLDLIWPVLVLTGIETVQVDPNATKFTPLDFSHYPYSHSLLMTLVWSALFGLIFLAWKKDRKSAVVLGLLVFSHWILDAVVHRPDLPILLEGPKIGLGLWNSKLTTVLLESALFIVGISLYLQSTEQKTRKSKWLLWSLIGFMSVIYLLNAFGPQPELGTPPALIAGPALAMWLFVAWAWAADKNSLNK